MRLILRDAGDHKNDVNVGRILNIPAFAQSCSKMFNLQVTVFVYDLACCLF